MWHRCYLGLQYCTPLDHQLPRFSINSVRCHLCDVPQHEPTVQPYRATAHTQYSSDIGLPRKQTLSTTIIGVSPSARSLRFHCWSNDVRNRPDCYHVSHYRNKRWPSTSYYQKQKSRVQSSHLRMILEVSVFPAPDSPDTMMDWLAIFRPAPNRIWW